MLEVTHRCHSTRMYLFSSVVKHVLGAGMAYASSAMVMKAWRVRIPQNHHSLLAVGLYMLTPVWLIHF